MWKRGKVCEVELKGSVRSGAEGKCEEWSRRELWSESKV